MMKVGKSKRRRQAVSLAIDGDQQAHMIATTIKISENKSVAPREG